MKAPLFEFPSFQYKVKDWEFKKKGLLKRIRTENLIRCEHQCFESDRNTNKKSYLHYFKDLFTPELNQFCKDAEVTCSMTDCWTVRYQKGDYQTVHNHRSWGFTGILYVEFDHKVHSPTTFVCPWQDPRTDTTNLIRPHDVEEGTMLFCPSFTLHYVTTNESRKHRTIMSFDLLPQLPDHQSVD